jgi:PAS domain S-box-containing protein
MMPNTALALVFLGFAGAPPTLPYASSTARLLRVLAALLVMAIGLLTIAEYTMELPFSIDQLFIRVELSPYPGRPSPLTAVALSVLAAAILASEWRSSERISVSDWLTLCVALMAFTFMIAQALGVGPLYRFNDTPVTGVAVPTALSLLLISVGLLLKQSDWGLGRIATSPKPGDMMVRQLAPVLVLIAVSLGFTGSMLNAFVDSENTAWVSAGLTVMGIALVLPLFAITARRLNRAYSALELEQTRTRELIELASEGILVADLNGRFTEVNEAGRRMLGYSREEILGKSISELIPPEDEGRLRRHRDRLLEGRSEIGEWTAVRKDGAHLPIEVCAKILPDGRWQAFIRDITERKHAEEALRLSEAKFSGIVSMSADAIVSVDEDHKINLFNEAAEKVFGRSKAAAIGAPLDVLIPERLRSQHARHLKDFEAGPDATRRLGARGLEIVGVRKNGEEFAADASISKIMVGGKRILTVALRDISEQKRIETEQRLLAELGALLAGTLEFEERLTNVARLLTRDLADVCILDVAVDDGTLRRARVSCREASWEWLCDKLRRSTLDSEPPRMTGAEHERGKAVLIQQLPADVIASWAPCQEDRTALRNAGFRSAIVAPLLARKKVLGVVSLLSLSRTFREADLRIVEAISQRAALLLDNVRLFAAAKRATQARDDMLAVVAHDLRNPLAAIVSLAAVLRSRGSEHEVGEEIEQAASRMNRLVQDLIDVTRLEAGQLSLERERLSVAELISDTANSQTPLANVASLELCLDMDTDLPDIWADRDRVLQVFENLIGNAIKFTKPGGHITLAARAGTGEVVFSVTDTGCGVAGSDLPHVFDRFWQAAGAKRRGVGLGLPIVKGIVEAHGGRVWVQSSLGQGTTFFFTVPVVRSHVILPTMESTKARIPSIQTEIH